MGYASIIPQRSSGSSRTISAGANQRWLISPNYQPQTIIFSFSYLFPVAKNSSPNVLGSDCSLHQLQIFDRLIGGNLIFSGCRASDMPRQWLYSITGSALIVFTTGSRDTAADFSLTYSSSAALYRCGSFSQPNIMTAASMTITDGSGTRNLMRTGEYCSWRLAPDVPLARGVVVESSVMPTVGTAKVTVTLIFYEVSLKYGSSVTVYDGSDSSGSILWICLGASVTVPPILTSSSSSLYIEYKSDTSQAVIYKGFSGDYFANFRGSTSSGRAFSTLAMATAWDIYPPGDRVTATTGIEYTWFVAPLNCYGAITFSFQAVNLVAPGASVSLYDGNEATNDSLMASFTGNALPNLWFTTLSTSAIVKYVATTAESAVNGSNFRLSYYTDGPNYHCGFSLNPVCSFSTIQCIILCVISRWRFSRHP